MKVKKNNNPTMDEELSDDDIFSSDASFDNFSDSESDSPLSDNSLDIFEEDETYDGFETSFNDNAQVQKIWLDADPYINNIYLSITNQEVRKKKVIDKKTGDENFKQDVAQIEGTNPLANKLGVSQIMSRVRGIFSKDIVMGNINSNQYDVFMEDFTIKMMRMLIANRKRWDIRIEDTQIIHDILCDGAHFYLTRPIADGERRSSRNRADVKSDDRPKNFFERLATKHKERNRQAY